MTSQQGSLPLQAAMRRAIRWGLVTAGIGAVAVTIAAGVVAGAAGVWGALVGAVVSAAFLLVTAVVGARTAGRDPLLVGTALLVSWLVKAVITLGVLALARSTDAIDPRWVGIGVIVGLIATLAAEYRSISTAQIPYVDPTGSSQ